MSLLNTKRMVEIAKEERQKKAELAFRVSSMATKLSEPGTKDQLVQVKTSMAEKERWQKLANSYQLPLSAVIRAVINQVCNELSK